MFHIYWKDPLRDGRNLEWIISPRWLNVQSDQQQLRQTIVQKDLCRVWSWSEQRLSFHGSVVIIAEGLTQAGMAIESVAWDFQLLHSRSPSECQIIHLGLIGECEGSSVRVPRVGQGYYQIDRHLNEPSMVSTRHQWCPSQTRSRNLTRIMAHAFRPSSQHPDHGWI